LSAEKNDEHFVEKWLLNMAFVVSGGKETDYQFVGKWELFNASAAQRAEAFVLTMEPE
jgi:hypothetical protein